MRALVIIALAIVLTGCTTPPTGRFTAVVAPDVAKMDLHLSSSVPLTDSVRGGPQLLRVSLEFASPAACTGNPLSVSVGQWPALGTTFDLLSFSGHEVRIRSEVFTEEIILKRARDSLRVGGVTFHREEPNKAPEPTTLAVTPRADVVWNANASRDDARGAPARVVAHL